MGKWKLEKVLVERLWNAYIGVVLAREHRGTLVKKVMSSM
jgi:hypothetical protein